MRRKVQVPSHPVYEGLDVLYDCYQAALAGLEAYNQGKRGAAEKLGYIAARIRQHEGATLQAGHVTPGEYADYVLASAPELLDDAGHAIHTIPVPRGWSPEQAWEAVKRGDELTDQRPSWSNIEVVDGRFVRVVEEDDE